MTKEELDRYIAEIVAKAPPLSPAQRDRIAALLRPSPQPVVKQRKSR